MDKESRANEIIERYRQGETLNEIAISLCISRERVRQILRDMEVDPMTGGAAIKRFLRIDTKISQKRKEEENREKHARRYWNMSAFDCAQIKQVHGRKPFVAYIQQRRNARSRAIPWEILFSEWWNLWQESGRWDDRGRGFRYVMARYGDSGPYSVENVYICTGAQNTTDSTHYKYRMSMQRTGL